MMHSLLNSIMSGPWFAIIVLAFIAIVGIIAVIRAITRDDDDDECECHKRSKYRYASDGDSLVGLSGSLDASRAGDYSNPNSSWHHTSDD